MNTDMMSIKTIRLAEVKLVLNFENLQKVHEEYKGWKYASSLPHSHTEIEFALRQASANGGIPATLEEMKKEGRNSHRLALYIYPRYSLNGFPSSRGDAYDYDGTRKLDRSIR